MGHLVSSRFPGDCDGQQPGTSAQEPSLVTPVSLLSLP